MTRMTFGSFLLNLTNEKLEDENDLFSHLYCELYRLNFILTKAFMLAARSALASAEWIVPRASCNSCSKVRGLRI